MRTDHFTNVGLVAIFCDSDFITTGHASVDHVLSDRDMLVGAITSMTIGAEDPAVIGVHSMVDRIHRVDARGFADAINTDLGVDGQCEVLLGDGESPLRGVTVLCINVRAGFVDDEREDDSAVRVAIRNQIRLKRGVIALLTKQAPAAPAPVAQTASDDAEAEAEDGSSDLDDETTDEIEEDGSDEEEADGRKSDCWSDAHAIDVLVDDVIGIGGVEGTVTRVYPARDGLITFALLSGRSIQSAPFGNVKIKRD